MALSRFSGQFNAFEFAYGVNPIVAPLVAINGPAATGAGTLTLAYGYFTTADGTVVNYPLNTNAPIIVGLIQSETVTPSSVSNTTPGIYGSPTVTATFTYLHGNGDEIRSGTVGLQEAINYCANVYGGGTVIVDARWALYGGTTAMLSAAVVPPNVTISDVRNGIGSSGSNVPSSLTQLAAPTAVSTSAATFGLLTTATTGGAIPATSTYRLGVTYVDAFGGETTLSIDTNALATIATGAGATNVIQLTSPAALAGAVGYRVYMTAAAGGTLTEILYPVGNAAITGTQSTASSTVGPNALPSFQIGTPVTITAIITGTAKVPLAATAYASATIPTFPAPVTSYPPFAALGTIAAAATGTLGSINFPAAFLNYVGRTLRIRGMAYATTNGTGGTITLEAILSSIVGVTSITPWSAVTSAIAGSVTVVNMLFDIEIVTASTGTTGTLEVHGQMSYNAAGTAVGSVSQDFVIAASSAVNLTLGLNLAIAHLNTTLGTTVSQLRQLTVEVIK
jgi:hypothetical protein